MHVLKILLVILEVLMLFNLLIFVHELGHFLAAKWRGLKVERFAIWFGKPIWKTKINGVEYALGSIPAGGYVSLPQMAPMEMIEGKTEAPSEPLPPISAIDKIIVAFAGPLFSFLLACAFAVVVWVVGRPVAESETTTTIGYVNKGGPADLAGLKPGDIIQTVDDHKITKFSGFGPSVTWNIVSSENPTIHITVKRGEETKTFDIAPSHEPTKAWQRKSLRKIQIGPAQVSRIDSVYPNSPAAAAGLKQGDEILAANGTKFYSPLGVEEYIESNGLTPVTLTVKRDGKEMPVVVNPEIPLGAVTNVASIGVNEWDGNIHMSHPDAFSQVEDSLGMMAGTFGALFDRKSEIKAQHLGGAVKILSIYATLFQDEDGWRMALWFSVVMNINLALLNLLPFPVLDGGHITLAIIEAVRRRAVSARILANLQTACAVLLIGYMLYLAFFDVQDLFPHGKDKAVPAELKFATKPQSPK